MEGIVAFFVVSLVVLGLMALLKPPESTPMEPVALPPQEQPRARFDTNPWSDDGPERLLVCISCSRQAWWSDARRSWDLHGTQVVQGLQIARCGPCAVGFIPGSDEPCGGRCDGSFVSPSVPYFAADRTSLGGFGEKTWSCWDEECVREWVLENSSCDCCGQDIDYFVVEMNKSNERTLV